MQIKMDFFVKNRINSIILSDMSIYLAVIYNTISLPLRTVLILFNQKSPRWERFLVMVNTDYRLLLNLLLDDIADFRGDGFVSITGSSFKALGVTTFLADFILVDTLTGC